MKLKVYVWLFAVRVKSTCAQSFVSEISQLVAHQYLVHCYHSCSIGTSPCPNAENACVSRGRRRRSKIGPGEGEGLDWLLVLALAQSSTLLRPCQGLYAICCCESARPASPAKGLSACGWQNIGYPEISFLSSNIVLITAKGACFAGWTFGTFTACAGENE